MSQPKRRPAPLLTRLVSATTAAIGLIGLAPQAARAQFPGFPGAGMAMPQAMLPSPFASGGAMSNFGAGTVRPLNMTPMMPGQFGWSSAAPLRTTGPAYSGGPFMGRSYGGSFAEPSYSRPLLRQNGATPARPESQGAAPSFYPDAPRRHSELAGSGRIITRSLYPRPLRSGTLVGTSGLVPQSVNNTANNYIYAPQAPVTAFGGPALLGGYYYGGYSDTDYGTNSYPTVYSVYEGFPQYIYNPGVVFQTLGAAPAYITPPLPFTPPQYTVTYNQNNYYVTNETKAADIEAGGAPAKAAVHQAYPADTYQAAFADIERAWTNGDLSLLKSHLRNNDTKISVFLTGKYKYSLNSSDFAQITRDAFDRLDTVSFQFTRLRKAKNSDVTAYGKHVYRVAGGAAPDKAASDGTIPFTDSPDAAPTDSATPSQDKTVYVSYTLRRGDADWYIVNIDSSTEPLLKE